jgi:hypothetical protein
MRSQAWQAIHASIEQAIENVKWPSDNHLFLFGEETKRKKSDDGNGVNPIKESFIKNLISSENCKWLPEDALKINWASARDIDRIKEIKHLDKKRAKGALLHGKIIKFSQGVITVRLPNGEEANYPVSPYTEVTSYDKNRIGIEGLAQLEGKNISLEARNPGDLDAGTHLENGKIFCVEWETGNISSSHRSLNKICLGILNEVLEGGVLILPTREMYDYLTDRVGNFEELLSYFEFWEQQPIGGTLLIIAVQHDGVAPGIPLIPKGKDGMAHR